MRIGLVADDETYFYEYLGMTSEWQELTIPYEIFKDFPMDKITRIEALKLIVVGKFQDDPKGEISIDELKVYKYSPKDIERLKSIMEEQRMEDPKDFLRDLYDKRNPY